MNQEIEDKILEKLPELKKSPHILHWSCGADSIATHIRMRREGIEPELVYMYYIKDLPLVKNYIDYYESKMKCHVHQLPHPFFWQAYENGLYQSPGIGGKMYKEVKALGWGKYTFKSYNQVLADNFPGHLMAQGLRASDSLNRRMLIKKHGIQIKNTWYPIASWNFSDIKQSLADEGLRLPLDYALIGRSFEGLDYWMAPIVKKQCPETWRMLEEYFPKIGLLCAQAEAIGTGVPKGATRRMKIYEGLAMDKGDMVW